jgi:uncharacterized protein
MNTPLDPQNRDAQSQTSALASENTPTELAPSSAAEQQPVALSPQSAGEPPLFEHWEQTPAPRPARIPHFGHLALLGAMALLGLLIAALLTRLALHAHLFGVDTVQQAALNINYTLGSQGILYLVTFASAFFFFPLLWGKSFFAGLQWNGATAWRLRPKLLTCAAACFVLAMLSSLWMNGPKDAPIDKIFRTPGAAWMLFAFGTTIAPVCEEIIFRGFLLPALCTTVDWVREKIEGLAPLPLAEHGHPQWSRMALVLGAIFTSLPFAAIHAVQTNFAWGPLTLLLMVSLILCIVRLRTRSLAASVLVHAVYNFLLFALMLIGTAGFRHLEKL